MKGFKYNDNIEFVQKLTKKIIENKGFCVCQVKQDETTMCPCDKLIKEGNCCCKLFVKVEE